MKQSFIYVDVVLILTIAIALSSMSFTTQEMKASESQELSLEIFNGTEEVNITVEAPDPMPISEYIRSYNMTKTGRTWRAINGSSYINPDHEVVQWFARNTMLNETGLYYLTGEVVEFEYYSDFAYENEDHWMNADYYLSHNLTGDCEDFAIGIASILEAKGVPNMVVALSNRKNYGHAHLEYYYNDTYYISDFKHPRYQVRGAVEYMHPRVWMFNKNNTYMTYNENWAEIY